MVAVLNRTILVFGLAAMLAANASAHAQSWSDRGTPSIMAPEPGERVRTAPRPRTERSVETPDAMVREAKPNPQVRRVRGSSGPPLPPGQSIVTPLGVAPRVIPPPSQAPPSRVAQPVPGFGTVPPPPASLNGQTFQDRAVGCAHYGATQGVGAGQIGAYTGGCANTR